MKEARHLREGRDGEATAEEERKKTDEEEILCEGLVAGREEPEIGAQGGERRELQYETTGVQLEEEVPLVDRDPLLEEQEIGVREEVIKVR